MAEAAQRIGVLAPWAATNNLGDYVIGDASLEALAGCGIEVSEAFPTHLRPALRHLRRAVTCDRLILAGTNALDSKMETNLRFWVTPDLAIAYRHKVVLMGVGWGGDDPRLSPYSRWVIRQILDPEALHSTRDSFTARILEGLGYRVSMTGCPSMWKIDTLPAAGPLPQRGLVTVSAKSRAAAARDRKWLPRALELFEDWRLQPMEFPDVQYAIQELNVDPSRVNPVAMTALDRALGDDGLAVVGTRLHAGMRSLQRARPTVILSIDNRAREMGKDFNLPVFDPSAEPDPASWFAAVPEGAPMTPKQRRNVDDFLGALQTSPR